MKAQALFILLVLMSLQVCAQSITDEGNIWRVRTGSFSGSGMTAYKISGDTAINEVPYKKILQSWLHPVQQPDYVWNSCFGYLREQEGKVYLRTDWQEEYVLFDFNLEVGDVHVYDFKYYKPRTLEVIGIDSVQFENGFWKKRISLDGGYGYQTWIEGLGGDQAFVPVYFVTDFGRDTICFLNDEELLYTFPFFVQYENCTVPVGIERIDEDIKMYPNPTPDFLNIELPNAASAAYAIFDLNAKEVLSGVCTSNTERVDIQKLNAGRYFVRIEIDDQFWYGGSLIKF